MKYFSSSFLYVYALDDCHFLLYTTYNDEQKGVARNA